MRREPLTQALSRLEEALLDAPILEAVIARAEAGVARERDAGHARALAEELCSFQLSNGSWGNSLARTSEALLLLHSLTPKPVSEVRSRLSGAIEWMRSREGKAGAFGEGCDKARHDAGLCNHALAGFFSPSLPTTDLSGLTLRIPARFVTDAEARLGVSCVALQSLLRWGYAGPPTQAHVSSLRKLVSSDALLVPKRAMIAGFVGALAALIEGHPRDASRSAAVNGIGRLLGVQRADGSWPGADTFQVLDLLLRASANGYANEAVDAAIIRAVEMLALVQRNDGSWGRETGPERMLVGWRALRHVVGSQDRGSRWFRK